MAWISVSDRMPVKNGDVPVLVLYKSNGRYLPHLSHIIVEHDFIPIKHGERNGITHWQYMDPPPS